MGGTVFPQRVVNIVFLGAGLEQANIRVGDFDVGEGRTVLLSCRRLWWPWWGLALPFCRAARNFFMAACSTWPVSLPVLTANAMVFCSISSCNCYPSLEVKAGRRHGLDTHPQAGKVVGANTYQIPVLSHFHAGGPPSAAYQYIKGFSAVQAAVVVRQVKTDVIVVCLLVKIKVPCFIGLSSFFRFCRCSYRGPPVPCNSR
mgnify:CR=1 FL=1